VDVLDVAELYTFQRVQNGSGGGQEVENHISAMWSVSTLIGTSHVGIMHPWYDMITRAQYLCGLLHSNLYSNPKKNIRHHNWQASTKELTSAISECQNKQKQEKSEKLTARRSPQGDMMTWRNMVPGCDAITEKYIRQRIRNSELVMDLWLIVMHQYLFINCNKYTTPVARC
jgi:hypothetical protein